MASFYRAHENNIYLDVESCEFFIPQSYFENGLAVMGVDTCETFGVFNEIFYGPNKKILNHAIMNIPSMITLDMHSYYSGTTNIAGVDTPCVVIEYVKNDRIMDYMFVEDSENAQTYLGMILKSKVPKNIPYFDTYKLWSENRRLNSVKFPVPSFIEEIILSVTYRNPNEPSQTFGQYLGNNPQVSQLDYMQMSIRQICQYASTFTGMTFEDFNAMVTTSINRSTSGVEEAQSPVEKIIKY